MSEKKNQHVVPHEGSWGVRKEGSSKVTKHFDRKDRAMDFAQDVAKRQGVERVEHNRSGKIVDKDSYGNDPNPPKDRKH